jgi:hypothetical protein
VKNIIKIPHFVTSRSRGDEDARGVPTKVGIHAFSLCAIIKKAWVLAISNTRSDFFLSCIG